MNRIDLINHLAELERRSVFVLSKKDLEKLFPNEAEKAMEKSLQRMVKDGLLVKATRGVYVNAAAASRNASRVIEEIAKVRYSERITRLIDHDQDASMEQKKREGYF